MIELMFYTICVCLRISRHPSERTLHHFAKVEQLVLLEPAGVDQLQHDWRVLVRRGIICQTRTYER